MDETLDDVPGSKIIKSMRLTLDIVKTNKHNKPWKVIYEKYWQTGGIVITDGKKVVKTIVDCNSTTLVNTYSGVYALDAETAEYLVKCVNEREDD